MVVALLLLVPAVIDQTRRLEANLSATRVPERRPLGRRSGRFAMSEVSNKHGLRAMSNKQPDERLFSEREAAARLGISRPTLLRLRRRGVIGHFRIGARILYSEDALGEFLSAAYKRRRVQAGQNEAEVGTDV
jgi:excisionase family DNA binding protein